MVNGLARALEQFAAEDTVVAERPILESNPQEHFKVESDAPIQIGGEVARATNENIVASFLATQGGQANLDGPVFLLWIDPIMPQVSAVTSTDVVRVGHTIDNGTVNESRGNGYYSGDGVTQLLVLSAAGVQQFEVQLLGLGGSFRVGINYITRESLSTVTIQDSLYKDDVRLVYDFASNGGGSNGGGSNGGGSNGGGSNGGGSNGGGSNGGGSNGGGSNGNSIIPRFATSTTSSDQAANSSTLLALGSDFLTAVANAAAKANASVTGNGNGSTGGENVPTEPANKADDINDAPENNDQPANPPPDAIGSLLKIFGSNEADIAQMPGGAVIQQVVNFFRQMFGQPTPPASGTNSSPSNKPAQPGTSNRAPNGTNPNSDAKSTTEAKATSNDQTVSQAAVHLPMNRDPSRIRRRRDVAKV